MNLSPVPFAAVIPSNRNFTVFPPYASRRTKTEWLVRLHTKKQPKFVCIINFIKFVLRQNFGGSFVSFHGTVISAAQGLSSLDTVLKKLLYLFFQRSSQRSDAWNPLMLIFSASSLAFVFRIEADTTTFLLLLLLTVRSHLKIWSSKCENIPSLSLLRFDYLLPCFFIDLKIFSLFLIQVASAFLECHISFQPEALTILFQRPLRHRTFLWLILCWVFSLQWQWVTIVKFKHNDPELNF